MRRWYSNYVTVDGELVGGGMLPADLIPPGKVEHWVTTGWVFRNRVYRLRSRRVA